MSKVHASKGNWEASEGGGEVKVQIDAQIRENFYLRLVNELCCNGMITSQARASACVVSNEQTTLISRSALVIARWNAAVDGA